MKAGALLVVLLLAGVLACSEDNSPPGRPRPTPTPAPAELLPLSEVPAPPDADLFDMTQRLRVKSAAPIPHTAGRPPPTREVGSSDAFTVTDLQTFTRIPVTATLRSVTPHAYWFVDDNMQVELSALQQSTG